MIFVGCSKEKATISLDDITACQFAERRGGILGSVKHDEFLERIDLKEYLIKDMDNPKQIAVIDALLAYHEKLNRILPLHQRQIKKANFVYRQRCLR